MSFQGFASYQIVVSSQYALWNLLILKWSPDNLLRFSSINRKFSCVSWKNWTVFILMHFNLNMLKSCTSTVTWPRLQCKRVLKHYFNRSQKYPHLIMFKMSNRLARVLLIVGTCTYIHVVAIFPWTWFTDLCIFSIPWYFIKLAICRVGKIHFLWLIFFFAELA